MIWGNVLKYLHIFLTISAHLGDLLSKHVFATFLFWGGFFPTPGFLDRIIPFVQPKRSYVRTMGVCQACWLRTSRTHLSSCSIISFLCSYLQSFCQHLLFQHCQYNETYPLQRASHKWIVIRYLHPHLHNLDDHGIACQSKMNQARR
jgi:hypothetical protein